MKKYFIKSLVLLLCLMFLATVLPFTASADDNITYKVITKVCNGFQNGTNSQKINFTFYGTNNTHKLTNVAKMINRDAFERNRTDTFTFSCKDLGEVYSLNVTCGTDAVKFEYIKIEKYKDSQLLATFSINEWIDNTNRTYYANRDTIYRIKVVTGDNAMDGSQDKAELILKDTAGKTASIALPYMMYSGSEVNLCVKLSQALGALSTATLTTTAYNAGNPDDWRPLYVQAERMSSSTTAGNIKWEAENLFLFDQELIESSATISRYTGSAKDDKASGLASIFAESNFYVMGGIVLVLAGSGLGVSLAKKKKATRKEAVK